MKKTLLCVFLFLVVVFGSYGAETKDYKTTLKELMVVSGGDETFKIVIPQMISMMKAQIPNVPEEFWEELQNTFGQTVFDDLIEMLVPIYQKHLTQADLESVIQFYNTPAGKKFGSAAPLISAGAMQVGQQWGMQIATKIQEKLKEKGFLK